MDPVRTLHVAMMSQGFNARFPAALNQRGYIPIHSWLKDDVHMSFGEVRGSLKEHEGARGASANWMHERTDVVNPARTPVEMFVRQMVFSPNLVR